MKRTFIAVKTTLLPDNKKIFSDLKLKFKDSVINWVDAENMHLTLFFLGDTSENQISDICKKLREQLKETRTFAFSLSGLGVFKNIQDPRVIWVDVENTDKLKEIKKVIDHVMLDLHFKTEERNFKPHLTVGRIKHLTQKNSLNELIEKYRYHQFQEVLVAEVIFYESILTPQGPIYKEIDAFALVK